MMINTTFGDGDYHQAKFNALAYAAPVEGGSHLSDAA